jgi:hypothetical protein
LTTHGTGILARTLIAFRRLSSRIEPYGRAILLLTVGTLLLIGLYTGHIPLDTAPQPERPHLAPPNVERIVLLATVLVSFTMSFVILRMEWDWKTQPIGMRINENIEIGFVKCLAIFAVAMSMSQGLDSLVRSAQVPSSARTIDFGIIAAVLLASYGPTKMMSERMSSFEELHDIVKHFILGLLFLVIMVNLFVTIPAVFPPLLQMIPVAIAATILDGLLSLIPANWDRMKSKIARYAEVECSPAGDPEKAPNSRGNGG